MNQADREISGEQLIEWFSGPIKYRRDIAFYTDENIALNVARDLREESVTTITAYSDHQIGEDQDTQILRRARELGCILVKTDADFDEINGRLEALGGLKHPGILLVKSKVLKTDAVQLAQRLIRFAQKYEAIPDWLENQIYTI
jgi:predicted nuclease of predicted toxin-antitoxin system